MMAADLEQQKTNDRMGGGPNRSSQSGNGSSSSDQIREPRDLLEDFILAKYQIKNQTWPGSTEDFLLDECDKNIRNLIFVNARLMLKSNESFDYEAFDKLTWTAIHNNTDWEESGENEESTNSSTGGWDEKSQDPEEKPEELEEPEEPEEVEKSKNLEKVDTTIDELKTDALGKVFCPYCPNSFTTGGINHHIQAAHGKEYQLEKSRTKIKNLPGDGKKECSSCGEYFHPKGISRHKNFCESDQEATSEEKPEKEPVVYDLDRSLMANLTLALLRLEPGISASELELWYSDVTVPYQLSSLISYLNRYNLIRSQQDLADSRTQKYWLIDTHDLKRDSVTSKLLDMYDDIMSMSVNQLNEFVSEHLTFPVLELQKEDDRSKSVEKPVGETVETKPNVEKPTKKIRKKPQYAARTIKIKFSEKKNPVDKIMDYLSEYGRKQSHEIYENCNGYRTKDYELALNYLKDNSFVKLTGNVYSISTVEEFEKDPADLRSSERKLYERYIEV